MPHLPPVQVQPVSIIINAEQVGSGIEDRRWPEVDAYRSIEFCKGNTLRTVYPFINLRPSEGVMR